MGVWEKATCIVWFIGFGGYYHGRKIFYVKKLSQIVIFSVFICTFAMSLCFFAFLDSQHKDL